MQKLHDFLKAREEEIDAPTLFFLVILLLLFVDYIALMIRTTKRLQTLPKSGLVLQDHAHGAKYRQDNHSCLQPNSSKIYPTLPLQRYSDKN